MKMNNKKSVYRQSRKKLVAMNMLLIMSPWCYAEVPLTDHKLSEQKSDSKHLDAESIQRAQKSMTQPIEPQKKESKALSDQNNQEIQKQNIDETALSDYLIIRCRRRKRLNN